MKLALYTSFIAPDCEQLEIAAESKNHSYRVLIDRKQRVPRYQSDTGMSRIGVNMMRVAMKHEKEALAYLDTPPYTIGEQFEKRCTLPERNALYNALSDTIAKEEI
jgi:hypothetical protein